MVTPRGTGKGKGLRNSGKPVRMTRARARIGGSPKDTPSLRLKTQFRPRRQTPPTTVSSAKVLIMMVISFSCYHHRCRRFLSFSGWIKTKRTRSDSKKHPYKCHLFRLIALNGCLCGCFTLSNTLECTSQGEYDHPRMSNDRAQSTAILGSGERVGDHRHFYKGVPLRAPYH